MLKIAALLASAAAYGVTAHCASNFTTFNSPTIEPFLHIDLLVGYPVNTTTAIGLLGQVPNRGGNVTGEIKGAIVPIGATKELFPPGTNDTRSFYSNTFTINTTDSTLLMKTDAILQYANNALYGLASITFEAAIGAYNNITFDSFVGQVSANFNTGEAVLDVFKLGPNGRVDRQPIPALLPPGQASA